MTRSTSPASSSSRRGREAAPASRVSRPPGARSRARSTTEFCAERLGRACRTRQTKGRLSWCLEDFLWFASRLTKPEGGPVVLEPHLLLICWELFVKGRVELIVLLPKGNGKTSLMAALAVFHLVTVKNAKVFIGAADSVQAGEMYDFAAHFVDSNPELQALAKVLESTRRIKSRRDRGFIRILASDQSKQGGKRQAFNPTLALVDELHAHENDNLYVDLRSGVFKRAGILVVISTAGHDEEESVLGRVRKLMLTSDQRGGTVERDRIIPRRGRLRQHGDGRLTIARTRSRRTAMLAWECRRGRDDVPDDDLEDLDVVLLVNPASWVTKASLEDALEAPSITPARFARYRANVWAQSDDAKIDAATWDALNTGATIPTGSRVVVTVDYARKSDAAAVDWLWLREPGKVVVKSHVWVRRIRGAGRAQPACHTLVDGRLIRQSLVREKIFALRDELELDVIAVLYDPHLFDPEELSDAGFKCVEFPQTDARMVPASKDLYEAIYGGLIEHDGDPVLRAHVTAAAAKDKGDDKGWRFSKSATKARIDALIALCFGIKLALAGGGGGGGFDWGDEDEDELYEFDEDEDLEAELDEDELWPDDLEDDY